jgi:hypothetical protein
MIHSTVSEDITSINYDWRKDSWSDEEITTFDQVYARNVHLNRIQDGVDIRVTRRMLNTARRSRQTLYSNAFVLYDRYRRLLAGEYNDPDISKLLADTLVAPKSLPRLFELFCVFRLLRGLRSQTLRLQPIEPGASQLAVLEDEQYTTNVYHDRTGTLSFHVPLSELDGIESDYAKRIRNVQHRHQTLTEAFLGKSSDPSLFHGRPDLIIEVYGPEAEQTPAAVVLGEVKYSNKQQTFTRGLEELLKYMEFAQKDEYLSDLGVDIHGLLITDDSDVNKQTPEGDQITHVSAQTLLTGNPPTEWIPGMMR